MNIKSEFMSKSSEWFPELKLWIILLSLVFSIFLSSIIIGVGLGIGMKIVFLIAGFITVLIWTYGNGIHEDEQMPALKQGLLVILLSLFFTEIPLYYNKDYTNIQNIKVMITNETRGETVRTAYKKARFYDIDTNDEIGSRTIELNEVGKEKMYLNITGKTIYIDYFPFFKYSEEFKYIRDK